MTFSINNNKSYVLEIKQEVVTLLQNYNGDCLFCQMPSRFVSLCTANVFIMEIIWLTVLLVGSAYTAGAYVCSVVRRQLRFTETNVDQLTF